jgi:membrane protein implicated in regulation of membrane protease activity
VNKANKKPKWSRHAVIKYTLLQFSELAVIIVLLILVRNLINYPLWVVWLAIPLLIVKDIIMFPFTWRAYDKANPNTMIGEEGTVTDKLSPSGYVRIQGELWRAIVIDSSSVIEVGETVTVRNIDGLTLHVQSESR